MLKHFIKDSLALGAEGYRKTVVTTMVLLVIYVLFEWYAAVSESSVLAVLLIVLWWLIVTYMYWQVGLIGVAVEWLSPGHTPANSTVWRIYHMTLIVIFTMGGGAALLGLLGAGAQYPYVLVMVVGMILAATFAGRSNLESWLGTISTIAALLALIAILAAGLDAIGISLPSFKATNSEQLAKSIFEEDRQVVSEKEQMRLAEVERIRTCRLNVNEVASLSAAQSSVYAAACNSPQRKLTLDELKEAFPADYAVVERNNAIESKIARVRDVVKDSDSRLLVGAVALLVGVVFLIARRAFASAGSAASAGAKPSGSSVPFGKVVFWVLFLGALAYFGNYAWNQPEVQQELKQFMRNLSEHQQSGKAQRQCKFHQPGRLGTDCRR